jgi:hypothetical protein
VVGMKFPQFVLALATALHKEDGNELSALLSTHGSKADELLNDLQDSRVRRCLVVWFSEDGLILNLNRRPPYLGRLQV